MINRFYYVSIFVLCLLLFSCKKEFSDKGIDKLSKLLKRMTIDSDSSKDKEIEKEYMSLSAEEYYIFDSLKQKSELAELIDSFGFSKQSALQELTFAWTLRDVLEEEALKIYNSLPNKLTIDQIKSVETKVISTVIDRTPILKEKNRQVGIEAHCKYFHSTGRSCIRPNIYYRYRTAWGYADNDVWAAICDSEHWYPGNCPNGVWGTDYLSRKAIEYYSGCLSRWWTGTNTGILIGFFPVALYVNSPSSLRMVAF